MILPKEPKEQVPPVKQFSVITSTGTTITTNGYQQACAAALDLYKKGTESYIVISYSNTYINH